MSKIYIIILICSLIIISGCTQIDKKDFKVDIRWVENNNIFKAGEETPSFNIKVISTSKLYYNVYNENILLNSKSLISGTTNELKPNFQGELKESEKEIYKELYSNRTDYNQILEFKQKYALIDSPIAIEVCVSKSKNINKNTSTCVKSRLEPFVKVEVSPKIINFNLGIPNNLNDNHSITIKNAGFSDIYLCAYAPTLLCKQEDDLCNSSAFYKPTYHFSGIIGYFGDCSMISENSLSPTKNIEVDMYYQRPFEDGNYPKNFKDKAIIGVVLEGNKDNSIKNMIAIETIELNTQIYNNIVDGSSRTLIDVLNDAKNNTNLGFQFDYSINES